MHPLPQNTSKPHILRLDQTGSVMTAIREGGIPSVFDSVFADLQTAGRGQYGRSWQSARGNVHGAIRLPKEGPYAELCAAAAVSTIVMAELIEEGFDVRMKWPNDIVYLRDGRPFKAGGILLEDRGGVLVAGIGLNLLWGPAENCLREGAAIPPGKLSDADPAPGAPEKRISDPFALWERLAARIAGTPPEALSRSWQAFANERLLWRGEPVTLTEPSMDGTPVRTRGVLDGVGRQGELLLQVGSRRTGRTRGSLTHD